MIARIDTSGRFAQAVSAGDLIFLAGQVAQDRHADVATQCRQVFERIDQLLAEAGSSRRSLLQMQVWLKDMADYAAFNTCYDAWIDPAAKPTRATVQAELIAPEFRVEVMVTAKAEAGSTP